MGVRSWSSLQLPRPALELPPLRLHDTASARLVASPSTLTGPASMYVCGITPYDATHLGHAATYQAFDLIHRYWLTAGRPVRYVQNVTDIDDPLFERAARDGVDWLELARQQTELYRGDMTALRILPPTDYVSVVDTIDEIIAAVERLLEVGAAYRIEDDTADIYFDHTFTGRFGYESGLDEATMLTLFAQRGGDPDRAGKRHRLDQLLWRTQRPDEPSWAAPFGRGRPGWHIECAAIAERRLGARIHVQGGGADLVFPHHEASAAHVEAMTGEHPFADAYVHAGMFGLGGEKMSKSLGNLVFVSRLTADGVDPMAIRIALLADHYRSYREWSGAMLTAATERLQRWRTASERVGAFPDAAMKELAVALADDLDTPRALRIIDDWAADGSLDGAAMALTVDALLGLDLR